VTSVGEIKDSSRRRSVGSLESDFQLIRLPEAPDVRSYETWLWRLTAGVADRLKRLYEGQIAGIDRSRPSLDQTTLVAYEILPRSVV
jgi:hypothetical protein